MSAPDRRGLLQPRQRVERLPRGQAASSQRISNSLGPNQLESFSTSTRMGPTFMMRTLAWYRETLAA
jgi:hypothetical protein